MATQLSGRCACGDIQYECTELPIVQLICHCRDCQRASGSASAAIMLVAADRLSLRCGRTGLLRGDGRKREADQAMFLPKVWKSCLRLLAR